MMDYRSPALLTRVACLLILCLIAPSLGLAAPISQSSMQERAPASERISANRFDGSSLADSKLSPAELLKLAREAVVQQKYNSAEALYQALLVRERQNVDAILELAAVYEIIGKLDHARGLLIRASVLRPHDETITARSAKIAARLSSTLHEEVDSLIAKKQCDLALPKLSMLLTIEPENPVLYFKKAVCHLELGRPKTALQVIDVALKLQKNEEYYKLRAKASEEVKKKEIQEYVQRAIPLMGTGVQEDKDEALQLVGKILQLDPEHKWGKQAFIRLTGGEDAANGAGEESNQQPEDAATVTSWFARTGKGILNAADMLWRSKTDLLWLLLTFVVLSASAIVLKRYVFVSQPLLSGTLSHFTLKEILSLLNSSARTGVVRVHSKSIKGEIFFENGEACHSKVGKTEGTKALTTLLDNARDGRFSFIESPSSLKKTIDTPLSFLLMGIRTSNREGASSTAASRKPKSRMKELLDSKK